MDAHNEEWDRIVSSFILQQKTEQAAAGGGVASGGSPFVSEDEGGSLWSLKKMQAYFCHVKSLRPAMSDEANRLVQIVAL